MAAASDARKDKGARRCVPRRGQVLKRVFASLFSWLPARRRRHRSPRGRRGNRVPAGGGHVEPEPDVAAARANSSHAHHDTTTNYNPPADPTYY
uniref:Uncharacterized protein n=1 Tax=Setaria viridis TaxID=4556 RepID=A0A4U6V949_SETVI|nr:hypothetical protein SEVIR_4G084000v2 [Setaria viridis]